MYNSNAWECIWLHCINNFFAMFVRSDQKPDMNDALIYKTVFGTIVLYVLCSFYLYANYIRNRKTFDDTSSSGNSGNRKTEWRNGRRASTGLLRMDDEDVDDDDSKNKNADGGSNIPPAFIGVIIGVIIYAVVLA
jgi:hypothetical protein